MERAYSGSVSQRGAVSDTSLSYATVVATPLLVCAFLAAGCGSNSRSPKPAQGQARARTVATDPATIEGGELAAMPGLGKAAGAGPAAPRVGATTDAAYLKMIFNQTQTAWQEQFKGAGLVYHPAQLMIFSEAAQVTAPCRVQAKAGPFYCGTGQIVYLDRRFLQSLAPRVEGNAFAGAYLVSQLVGRHVQRLAGIDARVRTADRKDPSGQRARIQDLELQADCLSGVWAHAAYTRAHLTILDIDQTLKAVSDTGDEFQTKVGEVPLDTGLWSQAWQVRSKWLDTGFESGKPGGCHTFSAHS